ncbi:MAG: caspase family protein [Gemmataceae bacterium]
MPTVSRVSCPGCRNTLRIPDEWLDKKIRCKRCGQSFCPRTSQPAPPTPSPAAPIASASIDSAADTIQDEIAPEAVSDEPFSFGSARPTYAAPITAKVSYRSWTKPVVFTAIGIFVVAAGVIGFFYQDLFGKARVPSPPGDSELAKGGPTTSPTPIPPTPTTKVGKTTDLPSATAAFPRRMMAIVVNNYLYANPTAVTRIDRDDKARGTKIDATAFLAEKLKVPKDQYYLLSDGPTDNTARPPLKPMIERSVEQFLATSRAQDRIMLIFSGHALDVDDQPYLVPMEGELTAKETLIPLKWVYDKLAGCPARQKVLVLDVCRSDPSRGFERPGSGPMGPKLDAMLAAPPAGVQVWSSCVGGQFSFEYDYATVGRATVTGAAFLSLMAQAFADGGGIPKPEESLPLEFLTKRVSATVPMLSKARDYGAQTPRFGGTETADGAAYDPAQAPPPRFDLPQPELLVAGGRADPKVVQSIFAEVTVPPLRLPRDAEKQTTTPEQQAARLAALVPFQAKALEPFAADYKSIREFTEQKGKYPLREAVLRAVDSLDRQGRLNKVKAGSTERNADRLIEVFKGTTTDDIKKSMTKTQLDGPALMLVELEEAHEALLKAEKERDKEPSKRWQAHLDYVLAQLEARMVYVHEYNTVIAKVKKDELPALDPKLHKGWRLAASERIQSPKDVKDLASDSKKRLAKLVKEYPGTPWEVLAKRERSTTLGLAWQPTSFAGE